jgi:hypothetical protein
MSRIKSWWGGRSGRTRIIVVAVVGVLAIGSASSAGGTPTADPDPSRIAAAPSGPVATATADVRSAELTAGASTSPEITTSPPPTPLVTHAPTPQPTPEPTPEPTPKATPVPVVLKTSGRGDKVVKFTAQETPTFARITAKSGGNFAVISYAGTQYGDLLVNTIGAYAGWVYIEPGMNRLKVSAGSSWTIEIRPIAEARRWDGTSPLTGKGDYVVNLTDSAFGTTTIKNKGQSNFAVVAYSEDGGYLDLLVNEIGSYNGEVLLPLADPIVLSIHAPGGAWSFTAVQE